MRILIISDIHANFTALQAVLGASRSVDQIWCLGDVVGYGPDPNQCIECLREIPNLICLLGNHDAAVLGRIPLATFNKDARVSIQWTRTVLTPASQAWLATLPESWVNGSAFLAHGSPRNPIWEYLLDPNTAALCFEFFDNPFCFVGHTHLPIAFLYNGLDHPTRWLIPTPGQEFHPNNRVIINPGSVGQPRDRDPRAAFGIFNDTTNTWLPQRIEYDIMSVQQRIFDANLPQRHAVRLLEGW